MDERTAKGYYPVRIEGRYQDGTTQFRAFLRLKDVSIYYVNYYRNMEGWVYSQHHEYYEKSYQYEAAQYPKIIENHQSFTGPQGERHQASWVVMK